jgi:hypothetical protein
MRWTGMIAQVLAEVDMTRLAFVVVDRIALGVVVVDLGRGRTRGPGIEGHMYYPL